MILPIYLPASRLRACRGMACHFRPGLAHITRNITPEARGSLSLGVFYTMITRDNNSGFCPSLTI